MMLIGKSQTFFVPVLFVSGLTACGGSDPESTGKSQSSVPGVAVVEKSMMAEEGSIEMVADVPVSEVVLVNGSADGWLSAYDPEYPAMVVEDNEVVSEEEIYQAWPQGIPVAGVDSASAEASAPVATETKTHRVNAQATSFSPNIIFINPGDTVQWMNMAVHDSVSMAGLIPEGAEPWLFKLGQNGSVTLTEEGIYIYKCNPHYPLGMVAAIIVGEPVNIKEVQANATGRSKGIVKKVVKALADRQRK